MYQITLRDLILSDKVKFVNTHGDALSGDQKGIKNDLLGCPAMCVQDCYDYVEKAQAQGEEFKLSSFLLPISPYPRMWVEFRKHRQGYWAGAFVFCTDRENCSPAERERINRRIAADFRMLTLVTESQEMAMNRIRNSRWILEMVVFTKPDESNSITGPAGMLTTWIEDGGESIATVVPDESLVERITRYESVLDQKPATSPADAIRGEISLCALPILLALSKLNCKNVELVDVRPDPKLSKAFRKRHGGSGLLTYKVLRVTDTVKFSRDKSDHRKTPPQGVMAKHKVRGYMAYYGMAGPDGIMRGRLFGKYKCRLWIEAHERGQEENGIVVKDYAMVVKESKCKGKCKGKTAPEPPICQECNMAMHRYEEPERGLSGWGCDYCGWSHDDKEMTK